MKFQYLDLQRRRHHVEGEYWMDSETHLVSREWVIQHVHAGVLLNEANPDPGRWSFSGNDLLRARRLSRLERDFDANPELAGLVVDMRDELERLRIRFRRAGLSAD